MSVLLAVLLTITVMWVTPALGVDTAATITGTTATISDTANSVIVPGYTVADADGDVITYAFAGTPEGLTIDSSTGVITSSTVQANDNKYTLSITTAADNTAVTQEITITVFTDAHPPVIGGTLTATVAENVAVGTEVGTSITVSDDDANDGAFYTISGTGSSDFEIDFFTGTLKVKQALDFETTPSYSLTLTVKDSKQTEVTDTITLTITDDKITAPLTSKIATLDNSVAIPAYTVTADAGSTYTFENAVTGLTIASSTGVVSATAALTAGSLNYVVVITTGGVEVAKETITNTVFTDAANPVIANSSVLTASVAKGVAVGTTVPITITVTDADGTDDGFTYEISGTGSDKFVMDYFTSVMKTAAALDSSKYTLDLVVKDSKRASATETLTINVTGGGNNIAHTPTFYVHLALGLVAMNYLFQ
ncbi:hypothetical protein ScPMuIL_012776 [Solemya velum]